MDKARLRAIGTETPEILLCNPKFNSACHSLIIKGYRDGVFQNRRIIAPIEGQSSFFSLSLSSSQNNLSEKPFNSSLRESSFALYLVWVSLTWAAGFKGISRYVGIIPKTADRSRNILDWTQTCPGPKL